MAASRAAQAIKKISSNLVVSPQSEEYDEILKSYFSEVERELKPAYFITPRSAQQVSQVLEVCRPFAGDLQIAICGAGQQSTPRVANVRDELTVHLRNLKGIQIDEEKKIVSVAAGERMGNVYEKLISLGLGVAGNRHSSGGIGGDAVQVSSRNLSGFFVFISAGGFSYYSYSRGFICDNVVNYEIALVSGEIVNASPKDNPDLFAALKGGVSNFGIVTRFDLQAFDQGEMWGGKLFHFELSFSGQIYTLVHYLRQDKPETDIYICLSLGYTAAMGAVLCMNDIFCLLLHKPKSLEPFVDIQL
jgi:FAD/FMN-containing dehydrogenase